MAAVLANLRRSTNLFVRNASLTRKTQMTKFESRRPLSLSGIKNGQKPFTLGKINHIAIAVPDLEKSTSFYRDILGAKVTEPQAQPAHGVYTVFIELGETKIELLHPYGEASPIAKFLERNKDGGMHHICIEVDDVEAAIAHLRTKNIRLLSETSKIGAHGKPVIFLHPKDCCGVLTELEQE